MLRAEGVVVRFPDALRCGPKTQSPSLVKGSTRSAAPRASCTTFVGFAPSMSTGPNCSVAHAPVQRSPPSPGMGFGGGDARDLQLAYLMLQYLHSTDRSSLVILPQVTSLPHNSISMRQ